MLRRHVGRRAETDLQRVDVFDGLGDPEIGDADPTLGVEHQVGRLEVAVDNTLPVDGVEPLSDLAADRHDSLRREPPEALQKIGQITTLDQLHREEVTAVGFAQVVDSANVGVGDLPGDPGFAEEELENRRPALEVGRQEFERHPLAELQVFGPENLPHPALPQRLDDPVALGNQGAGRESSRIGALDRHGAQPASPAWPRDISRKSQVLARRNLRVTVGTEIPSTSATSSWVMPAK